MAGVPHSEAMLAAALLHDTVEDTPVKLVEIEARFGEEVAALVGWLTDVSRLEDGNRATRKQIDLLHSAQATPEAKTIKLAEIIDNSISILAHDPESSKVYLRETAALLEVLKEGDERLWRRANFIVQDGLARLNTDGSLVS